MQSTFDYNGNCCDNSQNCGEPSRTFQWLPETRSFQVFSSSDNSVTCTMAPGLVFPYLSVPLSSAGLQCTGPWGQEWQLLLHLPGLTPYPSHGSPRSPARALHTAQPKHNSPKVRAPHCPFRCPYPPARASLPLEGKAAGPGLPPGLSPGLFPLHCQAVLSIQGRKNPTEPCNEAFTLGPHL